MGELAKRGFLFQHSRCTQTCSQLMKIHLRKAAGCLMALAAFAVLAIFMTDKDAGGVQELSRESTQVSVSTKAGSDDSLPASIQAKRDFSRQDFAGNNVSPVFCG